MTRAKIEHTHFRKLVAGEEVQVPGMGDDGPLTVTLILADIGWAAMLFAVEEAMRGRMHDALDEND